MATKAHLEGNKRHLEKLDDIKVRVPKGEQKDKIKAHAASKGMSVNQYILSLIEDDMNTKL